MSSEAGADFTLEKAEVAAHTILLSRGTYCIYVVTASPGLPASQLPGLGISAAPGEESKSLDVARLPGEPWLRERGDALLVRVHADQVRVLLTSYNIARSRGAAPPKIEVQRLDPPLTQPQAQTAAADSKPADLVVHVKSRGDIRGQLGEWVGDRGGNLWIEGFTIAPPPGLTGDDLEYQAVLGKGWMSPWVKAGAFCGSRGMGIPIQGLRLRLNHEAEKRIRLSVGVTFKGGTVEESASVGQICALDPLQPVTALRIGAAPIAADRQNDKEPNLKPETPARKRKRYIL